MIEWRASGGICSMVFVETTRLMEPPSRPVFAASAGARQVLVLVLCSMDQSCPGVWHRPHHTRARSQPAIAGGAVYVGSQNGSVFALDRETGCIRWTFNTVAEVRNAIVIEPWVAGEKVRPSLFFGDITGNVYAVDAVSGELRWRDRPDDHPSLTLTAAPVLHNGTLYVPLSSLEVTQAADPAYACCTFRGGVAAPARSGAGSSAGRP